MKLPTFLKRTAIVATITMTACFAVTAEEEKETSKDDDILSFDYTPFTLGGSDRLDDEWEIYNCWPMPECLIPKDRRSDGETNGGN
ncbi:hypothetical protein [Glaciecola sp. 1036]|uniref:hypothetical protein n=1 Tax=Alteromonadaceae TaxID=72275 RepID=UPI003CFBC87A